MIDPKMSLNVAVRKLFKLMIKDIFYTPRRVNCVAYSTLSGLPCTKIEIDDVHLLSFFLGGVLGFNYPDWLLSRICLCDSLLKASDIEGLSGCFT